MDPPMFRFTIRDVLWLTVVVALGVAWWVARRHERELALQNAREQQSQFQIVSEMLLKETGIKTSVDENGLTIRLPNGTEAFYPTSEWEAKHPDPSNLSKRQMGSQP
jgi:hypothetical protein